MEKQITLSREVSFEGIGLHSGKKVSMKLKPAPIDSGIQFVRTDLPENPIIHARAENVTATLRATTIEENGFKLFTIEHLMSAIHASQIDNLIIEIDAEEPPVADGASLKFFELIKSAGFETQNANRKLIEIDRVYRIDSDDKRFVTILPYNGFRVSFTSINPHKLVGIQYQDFEITPEIYEKEIAPARTIAYEKEIEQLKSMGLGLGGTLENVIVYNDETWLNQLRFPDELVRHKILDVIGDLRLCGIIRGHVIAAASSHALNSQLAKQISKSFS
ncbi:MAG: UDP-3-O-[Selenomonadaceae bacterium]|nr:UDP-3-O-[3-hydroxymyristoyl] N-acetylglucosamine deacetylase [Selenomonadaceae bacterium]